MAQAGQDPCSAAAIVGGGGAGVCVACQYVQQKAAQALPEDPLRHHCTQDAQAVIYMTNSHIRSICVGNAHTKCLFSYKTPI